MPASDAQWMGAALTLGLRGSGRTTPNPDVGCVIVRDGRVVGRGWTQPGGRPHAEAMALDQAGVAARGATVFTTLEPCAHLSIRGPACADLLVAAGVARVVAAMVDPDPRTAGRGLTRLAAAGIDTACGVRGDEAARAMAGFLTRRALGRPFVTLKLAMSLDGCIATAGGESRWITGAEARAHTHLVRSRHDAILVGRGTWAADRPRLDVRLAGLEARSPWRVVLSGRGGGGADDRAGGFADGWTPEQVRGDEGGAGARADDRQAAGRGGFGGAIRPFPSPRPRGGVYGAADASAAEPAGRWTPEQVRGDEGGAGARADDRQAAGQGGFGGAIPPFPSSRPRAGVYGAANASAAEPVGRWTPAQGRGDEGGGGNSARGWTWIDRPEAIADLPGVDRLMVEGGAATAAAFLRAGLVDRLLLYRAPVLIGGGLPGLGDYGLGALAGAHGRWRLEDARSLGVDRVEVYGRRACLPES